MTAGEAKRRMAAFPVADLATLLGGRDPLVLAPHPDDESLGCGGLLASCAAAGGRPAVLVLTDGSGSHPNSQAYPKARLRRLREAEARQAAAALGLAADRIAFLGLPDTAAPTAGPAFEAAVTAILAVMTSWRCAAMLAPWRHDPHCDHAAAHLMAASAAARADVAHLAYPVWGWTLPEATALEGPAPTGWRLDVSAQLARKRRAIAAHRSQHAGLVDDDPGGFQLQPGFLARFDGPFETFLNLS